MINPSPFLRRAIQADAIFSGASAVLLTLGAGALAPAAQSARGVAARDRVVFNCLCRAGRLARHTASHAEGAGADCHLGNAAWTLASIALLFSGAVTPNLLGELFVAAQAIVVGALAELQYIGLRKSGGEVAA